MVSEVKGAAQPGEEAIAQAQAQTDLLLERVALERAEQRFDPEDQETLRQLVEDFADRRGMTRLRIAETLGAIGKPATDVLLTGLASHENPVVRRACAKTITLIKDPKAIPTLVEALLHDEDTVVHGSAAGALAQIGAASVPVMLEILGDPQTPETTKGHLAWALSFVGNEAKEAFYAAAAADAPEVRSAMVGAIAKVAQDEPEDRAFALLINALGDSVAAVRSEAAAVLGNLAHRPALPQLLEMLQHELPESRKAAALALMKIGAGEAIAPLNAQLEQESDFALEQVMRLAVSQLEGQAGADAGD